MKCTACGKHIKNTNIACDWQQGRCPQIEPALDNIFLDNCRAKVYTLFNTIKGWINEKRL